MERQRTTLGTTVCAVLWSSGASNQDDEGDDVGQLHISDTGADISKLALAQASRLAPRSKRPRTDGRTDATRDKTR